MPPKKKKETWANSEAKAILRRGILNGTLTTDMLNDPDTLYVSNSKHAKWKLSNWKANLENLRNAIARDKGRMLRDARDYGKDKKIVMDLRHGRPLPWHKTTCPKLLKQDVDDSRHFDMSIKDLYLDRPEYQAFDLEVFRKHVHQEVDCRPKREIRFERKKKAFKYPELHVDHPRLKSAENST